jgi:hypothetical protein
MLNLSIKKNRKDREKERGKERSSERITVIQVELLDEANVNT